MNPRLEKLIESLLLDFKAGVGTVMYDISDAGIVSKNDLALFEKELARKAGKYGYSVTVFYPRRASRLKANGDEKLICRIVQMPDNYHVAVGLVRR